MKRCKLILIAFLLGLSILPVSAEIDLTVNGSVALRAKFTPEEFWQVERKLHLNSLLDFGDNIHGKIGIKGLGSGDNWLPIYSEVGTYDVTVDRVTVYTKAPLYPGCNNVLYTVGDIEINYSDYALRVDDSLWYNGQMVNPHKRGAALFGFNLPLQRIGVLENLNAVLDLGIFWDTGNSRRYHSELWDDLNSGVNLKNNGKVYAARLNLGKEQNNLLLTSVNFVGNVDKLISDSESDRYKMEEQTVVLEQKKQADNFSLQSVWGLNRRQYNYLVSFNNGAGTIIDSLPKAISSEGRLSLVEFGYKFGPLTTKVGYQYIDPNFDPEYRDRRPRYDKYGKLLSWNPIDSLTTLPGVIYGTYEQMYDPQGSYRIGKQGTFVAIDAKIAELEATCSFNQFKVLGTNLANNNFDLWDGRIKVPFGKNTFRALFEQISQQNVRTADQRSNKYTTRFLKGEVERPLVEREYALSLVGSYEYEDLFNTSQYRTTSNIFLAYEIQEGKFVGLGAKIGLAYRNNYALTGKDHTLYKRASLAWRIPSGLSILANWTTPNSEDNGLYDRYGKEYIGEDNLLELSVGFEF